MGEPKVRVASFSVDLRRFLVVFSVALWQGGFLFYASVVVPIGTEVLGSTAAQGAITRRVTGGLNVVGVVTLAILAREILATSPRSDRVTSRWAIWSILLLCQYLLFFLHQVLEYLLAPGPEAPGFARLFYRVHGIYLWIQSALWLGTWLLIWLTFKTWRQEDPWRTKALGK